MPQELDKEESVESPLTSTSSRRSPSRITRTQTWRRCTTMTTCTLMVIKRFPRRPMSPTARWMDSEERKARRESLLSSNLGCWLKDHLVQRVPRVSLVLQVHQDPRVAPASLVRGVFLVALVCLVLMVFQDLQGLF